MTKTRAGLTELEGAILCVIRSTPGTTAYRVRQTFLVSRSAEWSGSAGAVYPAIARLEAVGLLSASAETDKRGTRTFRLTGAGKAAHERWLCDERRTLSPGLDPFRTRAGFWSALPPQRQRKLMQRLQRAIRSLRAELVREQRSTPGGDRIMLDLHIELQDLRLRWLDRYLKAPSAKSR